MFQKIIVRLPNWIGDFVMATPALADLRRHFPAAHITAMSSMPISELLQEDPAIDEILSFTKPDSRLAERQNMLNISKKLRMGQYDLGILLTNSFSSALWFWLGNVKRRLGYAVDWRSLLLTDRMEPPDTKIHQVECYKHLVQPLGIPISVTAPRLFLSEKEEADAREFLYQRGICPGQTLIGINPGAAYGSAKCWPPERFRSLASFFLQDPQFSVLFFGDAQTQNLVNEICSGLPERVINLAGATNLRQLACLIKNCDVLVTNDSGPMHMGVALQTPVVALFGSTDDVVTGPWGQKEGVINKHHSCSPCFKRTCSSDFRCMYKIEVEEVAQKALERRKRRV
jgi:heptosyltransferase II